LVLEIKEELVPVQVVLVVVEVEVLAALVIQEFLQVQGLVVQDYQQHHYLG
jgi:hypothetical protein